MAQPKHLEAPAGTSPTPRAHYVFFALVALFCATYAECAYEIAGLSRTGVAAGIFYGTVTLGTAARILGMFLPLFATMLLLASRHRLFDWLADHRLLLATLLLVLLVIFEISGSSVAMWGMILGESTNQGTLLGIPRSIRSDEWLVFTPLSFSQDATGDQAVSSVVAGGGTNMTMVYGQPAWALATLFRPFLWGHLVLGPTRGLSFFWCARAICLVLMSFECILLLSNGRRRLAVYGAILVGFAPMVEWWFAVNGTAELFIFGQGLVLALHHALRANTAPHRWGWSLLLGWLLGCYALILYPSWQIPVAYAFAAMGLWDAWTWVHEEHDVPHRHAFLQLLPALLVAVLLAIAGVGISVYQAWDAVQSVLHTAYPGDRFFTGGGLSWWQPNTLASVLSPLWPDLFQPNVCEAATFVSLQPVGMALAVMALLRGAHRKTVDAGLLFLLAAEGFLLAYGILGFPEVLSRLTLLGNVQTNRVVMATGYLDVALLVRSVAVFGAQREAQGECRQAQKPPTVGVAFVLLRAGALVLLTIAGTCLVFRAMPELVGVKAAVVLACALAILLAPLLLKCDAQARDRLLLASACVVLVVGFCVNPVQRGAQAILSSPTLAGIKEISASDSQALWLTDSSLEGQACVAAGVPTITSINIYPQLDRWQALDPSGTYRDVYNRYALIYLRLGDQTAFQNPTPDSVLVTLAPNDAPKLKATYWLSGEELSRWNTDSVSFVPVKDVGGLTVFRIEPVAT